MTGSATPVAELLLELVAIDSTNPLLVPGGAGEGAVVRFLAERLGGSRLELDVWDVEPGRPNLVARLRGSGGGRALIVCGHSDVVGAAREGFRPRLADGRVWGRGALDMKGGIAAAVVAVEQLAAGPPLAGDVLLALCVDEEWRSAGAEALVARYRADAAILPEPTGLDVVTAHGGFAWYDLLSEGVEAAGDDTVRGVDAISLFGPSIAALADLDRQLAAASASAGPRGSVHASVVRGGETYPSYPGGCRLSVERCLVPGETVERADAEIAALLAASERADPRFRGSWSRIVGRDPVVLDGAEPVVAAVLEAAARELGGRPVEPRYDMGWMDSGILSEAGIPCVVFGPAGHGEHTAEEWVDVHSLDVCSRVLEQAARSFCA
jgi:acetylornithine deacetylase/succinyl-diaminopimelate desuccinylase-like protein